MKSAYFTTETINSESNKLFAQINEYIPIKSPLHSIETSALLILDMQDYFLNTASHAYIPSAGAIIPGLKRLIRLFSDRRRPVIFTRHINTDQNANRMGIWWGELITEDNPLSQLTRAFNYTDSIIIIKSQYDAFYNTPLKDILNKKQITQLVIGGVMTHLCCETTARSAFIRGFDVFFTIDGTATYNEDFHRASLLNLSHGVATPVLIKDVINHCG